MKKIIIILMLTLFIATVTGCNNDSKTKEETNTTVAEKKGEIHEQAYQKFDEVSSVFVQEKADMSYSVNGVKSSVIVAANMKFEFEPFKAYVDLFISFNGQPLASEVMYFIEENDKMYQFKRPDSSSPFKKEEVLVPLKESDNLNAFYYSVENRPTNLKVDETFQEFNKIKYTTTFKLNDLGNYKNMFDDLLVIISDETKSPDIYNLELKQEIIIDTEKKEVLEIRYDLSNLLNAILKSEFGNIVRDVNFIYTFKFENYNNVTIDLKPILKINEDDAVNTKADLSPNAPIYQIGEEITGNIQYVKDADFYKINVTQSGKIYFYAEGDKNTSINLYNSQEVKQNKLSIRKTGLSYQGYAIQLSPGTYYLKVESDYLSTETGYYKITSQYAGIDDYSNDFYDDGDVVGLISQTGDITGKIDYVGDVDIFKLNKPDMTNVVINMDVVDDVKLVLVSKFDNGTVNFNEAIAKDGKYRLEFTTSSMINYHYILIYSESYIGEYSVDVQYYSQSEDDYPNNLQASDIKEINIEDPIFINCFLENDYEVFKLNVTESSWYNISLKSTTNYSMSYELFIYDSNKALLKQNTQSYYFESGVYYIRIRAITSPYSFFNLNFFKVIDDVTDPKPINLENGTISFRGLIDYEGDTDILHLNLTESKFLALAYEFNRGEYFRYLKLVDSNDNEILSFKQSDYLDGYNSIYLEPGDYYIKLYGKPSDQYKLNVYDLSQEPVTDDYTYTHHNGITGIGTIVMGDNIIQSDYYGDLDVYQFEVSEAGTYQLTTDLSLISYYNESGNLVTITDLSQPITLSIGKYYFYFRGLTTKDYQFNISKINSNIE